MCLFQILLNWFCINLSNSCYTADLTLEIAIKHYTQINGLIHTGMFKYTTCNLIHTHFFFVYEFK